MQSSSLLQVRMLNIKLFNRHVTHVTYIGFTTKLPADLEKLTQGKDLNTRIVGFIVGREGKHYSKADRMKLIFKDNADLLKILQDEDDLASTFKLFGPFGEQ